ncbi:MAG: hydrogenase nickel incorporation protein HypB [Pseudolabrys sp.]|jgi:hydrogenase nickel incorporation protein HypB
MCATCGCQDGGKTTMTNLQTGTVSEIGHDPHGHYGHFHADGTWHSHAQGEEPDSHDHDHGHHHGYSHDHSHNGEVLNLETRVLAKNNALAATNRAWFAGREILALNLLSSPGAGKTTLLERTIADLSGELSLYVIEGDQAGANDGERIRRAGAPAVQVNTGTGCHLDADMTARALAELKPAARSVVLIENVGNLVCPALFDLGERAKVVIFSATEGEDKPLKYPHIFRAASLVLLNKCDLLPHLDFFVEQAVANLRQVNADAPLINLSARTGEGLDDWYRWVRSEAAAAREFAMA